MNIIMNAEKYRELCLNTYELINNELKNPLDIEMTYPKLVIMYEFFRLLRGEAFTEFREPTADFQKEMYTMENNIHNRLVELKVKIPENSSKAKFHFENLVTQDLRI